jgi:hypothetical protein
MYVVCFSHGKTSRHRLAVMPVRHASIIPYQLRLDRDMLTEAWEASGSLSAAICNANSFIEYRDSCDVLHVARVLLLKYLE